ARDRAVELGVELVAGCELSCEVRTGTMHLLVYFVEPGEGPLQDRLAHLQEVREDRNRRMVDRLRQLGMDVTYDELLAEAGGRGVGRPHAAAVLVRKGIVSSVQEAFERYLAKGKPGYVEKERLSPREAVRLAVDSGAKPVLAHPFSLRRTVDALESVVEELRGFGLAGLECLYSRYSPDEREALSRLAQRNGLVATGGSDHHGSYKPDLSIGVGTGDLNVPDRVLDDLRNAVALRRGRE
ncbi:MAG: phosphoesterase, partial [Acidimicrobiia bacterium]